MQDMKADIYETIVNLKGSYANFNEALADELYQNIFDNTQAHFQLKEGRINKLMDGTPCKVEIEFDDETNSITVIQKGTTGIIEREAYIELAKKTKSKSERGSRGQGWKIWLNCTELVFTETVVKENDQGVYYVNIFYPNRKERKIRVSKWAKSYDDVFIDLKSDGVDILHYQSSIKSELIEQGTRIVFYNISEITYNNLKNIHFKSTLIKKWYPLLIKNPNYEIFFIYKNPDTRLENRLKIEIPNRPLTVNDVNPIKRGFYKLEYDDLDTSKKRREKITDINLYYSKDESIKYYEKGIAVIVLDRVVMYHKIPDAIRIDGFIFGEINANFLHDLEDSMHSVFYDEEPWNKTKRIIEKWGRELVSKVRDLGDISLDVTMSNEDYIDNINDFLKDLIKPSEEELSGRTSKIGNKKESNKDHDEIKLFTFLKTYQEDTDEEISNYKRGQNIDVKIGIMNPLDENLDVKLKFYTVPNIGGTEFLQNLAVLSLESLEISLEYLIENRLPRGNITFIAELYPKKDLESIEQIQSEKKNKPIDVIKKKCNLERLISSLKFTKKNYSRDDKIIMKAEFESEEIQRLSLINTYVRTSIRCREIVKRNNENILKKSIKDIDENYQLDKSDERGKYLGFVEIIDKTSSIIIDKASSYCNIERFLVDLIVPSRVIKFEEEFDIIIKMENPTHENIHGLIT